MNKEIDGDSGTPVKDLPPLTIGDQDDREYWNQPRVLASTGKNWKVDKGGILEWFQKSCEKHGVPKDAKVLVIGGGPGRLVKGMQQLLQPLTKDWHITVAEGSAGMVENAKKNLAEIHPDCPDSNNLCKVDYLHKNAMDLEYKEQFDVIWTCTVLQHNSTKNKDIFVPKMYNALKPQGLYICLEGTKTERMWVDPTPEYPEGQFKKYNERGRFTFDWSDSKGAKGTAAWFINYIGKHGFEIQEYGSHHIDWFVFRKIREVGENGAEES